MKIYKTREEFLKENPPIMWSVEFTNKEFEQRIYLRNLYTNDGLDWVYEDEDRIFELYVEIGGDTSVGEAISIFIDYCSSKFGLDKNESEILDYLIRDFNWTNIKYCIDILTSDVDNDVHNFLMKYNFKILPTKK